MKRSALRRKLKEKAGFTLAELLMAVLILLMVSSIVAMGIPVAVNAYYKVVDASNAQILLSTTITRLRSELAYVTAVKTDSSNAVLNFTNGYKLEMFCDDEGIKTQPAGKTDSQLLVPSALTNSLKMKKAFVAKYDGSITFDGQVFTITNLQITKDGNVVAGPITKLEIRPITNVKIEKD